MESQERVGLEALESAKFSASDILKNIYHAIIVTDTEGTILYWNDGGERLFGYSKEEMVGKKASKLYPKSRRSDFPNDLKNLNNGGMMTGQWLGRCKDGSWRWF
ncbi:MAG: PAS domain-containing protein, partial [Candidatus Halalkalibacterium sp. M3_1C_030]